MQKVMKNRLYLDVISRCAKQRKMTEPEKILAPIQKTHAIKKWTINNIAKEVYFQITLKVYRSRVAAMTEDESLMQEFYGNDSLGG